MGTNGEENTEGKALEQMRRSIKQSTEPDKVVKIIT